MVIGLEMAEISSSVLSASATLPFHRLSPGPFAGSIEKTRERQTTWSAAPLKHRERARASSRAAVEPGGA
jgi:hypothetical protein